LQKNFVVFGKKSGNKFGKKKKKNPDFSGRNYRRLVNFPT